MDDPKCIERSWVAATVSALNREESWTGRVHVHKTLFIMETLGLATSPFYFDLYRYGPYSFDLDERISDMECYGYLTKTYPEPGYGPKYSCSQLGEMAAKELTATEASSVNRVATKLGSLKSGDLELIATCLWAEQIEKLKQRKAVIAWVGNVKPKYSREQIEAALERAGRLGRSLSTTS